ncbi:PH domain-containing protein [Clostridium butyricum]|uniref:YokE-like PH domain-containing protein n=1 Tax=Clostridium butyricum TaxID=1492 RepID=A0A6N3DDS9_CLOBU|nr:hypothetical protein [Clostridium butyricum]ENZ32212.1 hypothetical protein HMPREF1084_02626 [Clostridium butyricum 60E.3]MDU3581588.1 hypothetical protein [Clostridium butyricum]MDU3594895.1 hypothetical protein [Clostridium butyricum]
MFSVNLNDDDILMKINASKSISKKDVLINFVGNLLTSAGGDIANKVWLILTNDTLYLEYKGHAAIGYAEETRDLYTIPLKELTEFLVTSNKNEELIKITTNQKKFVFIRNNTRGDSLALAMSKVINDIK